MQHDPEHGINSFQLWKKALISLQQFVPQETLLSKIALNKKKHFCPRRNWTKLTLSLER